MLARGAQAFRSGCICVCVGLVLAAASTMASHRQVAGQAPANPGDPPAVPRFEIETSPIELTGPVRPGEYLGVTGPRSAWLGLETGAAELWVHPLKVANAFRLSFSARGSGAPVPADRIARTVHVRPEITTIVYSHAAFQVRQHILAPAEMPGILILLEIDSSDSLEVAAEFEPVLNYMWPASLGGQYAYWDAARRVFVLSESLQAVNAVVGSPWATNSVEHPAHQLGQASPLHGDSRGPRPSPARVHPHCGRRGDRAPGHRLRGL